ncbi:phosphate uptake regulator, PhoU [Desulfomicrobium apsheronum]|jgi:phosphate transport system protein|uniref:Phosphate-specific transport system accessory protein PhoU n=1 Tax=Desulfomicrobium apsheronum TaxID=52560 RepID=A0A1I3XJ94_9BACT|nr:phosphate signaling complex protein PhoU [Desulfomicrobium apsheronum]SFK19603.1 phosphate uptake regulator, PhoU [Desulfomicrobium apsheronum]
MYTHLHEEIETLKLKVLKMVSLTEDAVQKSIQAYVNKDLYLAEEVQDGDVEVNRLEVEIDELALKLLALEQPVAGDLRFILGCMRISVDLERIADEAVNIAERSIMLSSRPPLPFHQDVLEMGTKALAMLRHAAQAFSSNNVEAALQVCHLDNEVDVLNHKNMRQVIEYMIHETPAIERSVHTIILIRRLERIGDLATNIAESVVFIAQGVNIKHKLYFDER